MRVAELTDGFYPGIGSATGAIGALVEGLPEVDFEIITNHLDGTPLAERFRPNCIVRRFLPTDAGSGGLGKMVSAKPLLFPRKVAADWVRFSRKLRYLDRTRFDIVHFNGPLTNYGFFSLDRLLGRPALTKLIDFSRLPCRKVITFHGLPSLVTHSSVDLQNELKQLSSFDCVTVVDRELLWRVRALVAQIGKSTPVHFVPNGIDTRMFAFRPFPQLGSLQVGYLGRLSEEKGCRLLIELAHDLPQGVELRLAVTGAGSGREAAILEKYDRVTLLRDVPYSRVPDFLASIHILLNPALHAGVTRATLEAMSVGRPAIMPPIGDRYPLVDGLTGFICPPSAVALGSLLTRLIRDRQTLEAMAGRCREVVEREFDLRIIAGRFRRIFAEAAA